MGATGSKPDQEVVDGGADATFFAHRDSPVQFSESLINHLSSQSLPTSAVPSSRQDALDSHIQARIATELSKLRQQEAQVRDEIERALEKENLDREMGAASAQEGGKALSHSTSLIKDLEELEKRTASLKKQREETDEWRRVDDGKNELEKCFAGNMTTPLNCRTQAEKFQAAVAAVEKVSLARVLPPPSTCGLLTAFASRAGFRPICLSKTQYRAMDSEKRGCTTPVWRRESRSALLRSTGRVPSATALPSLSFPARLSPSPPSAAAWPAYFCLGAPGLHNVWPSSRQPVQCAARGGSLDRTLPAFSPSATSPSVSM
ncbi:hypothetical protein JCM21900_003271 [Sporobolomyces salmonicolor]